MADATQVQIRRDTAANLATVTPALAELAYDTTNKSIRVGDGTTIGATYIPNASDIQSNRMTSGVVSGTANNIIVTLPFPLSSYSLGTPITFQALANNTGNMTLQVGALSADPIKIISNNALAEVPPDTVVEDGVYTVTHDGMGWQLTAVGSSEGLPTSQNVALTGTGTAPIVFNVDFAKYRSYELVLSNASTAGGNAGFFLEVYNGTAWVKLDNTGLIPSILSPAFITISIVQPDLNGNMYPTGVGYSVNGTNNIIFARGVAALTNTPNQIRLRPNGAVSGGFATLYPTSKR